MFKLTLEGDGDRLINAGCLQLGGIDGSVGRSVGSEARDGRSYSSGTYKWRR